MTDLTATTEDTPTIHHIEWPCWGDLDCHCCGSCSATIATQEAEITEAYMADTQGDNR
jgi:hypothetical protein